MKKSKNIFLILVILIQSCVFCRNEKIIVSSKIGNNPLSIEFDLFYVHNRTINECLLMLSDSIEIQSPNQPKFLWSTQFYGVKINKPEPQPKVCIKLINASLKDVFDEICKQTGWIYVKTPYGFNFMKLNKKINGLD